GLWTRFYPVVTDPDTHVTYGANITRIPLDLGVRLHLEWWRRLRFAVQLSFVAIPEIVESNVPGATQRDIQVAMGISGALEFRVALIRQVDIFAGISATYLGRQADLLQINDISGKPYPDASAPYPWLTASFGVVWSIR